jgi:hypothetical protein
MEPKGDVRKVGVKRVGLSLLGCMGLYGAFLVVESLPLQQSHSEILYAAAGLWLLLAIAYACIGLVEIVAGRPFGHLAAAWTQLVGWQRGVLGAIIVLGAIALATVVGILIVRLT